MTNQTSKSVIFVIEDGTDVSASISAMLEAADHQVERICDAACFSNEYLGKPDVQASDVVMINLDGNRRDNFQLLNVLLASENSPAVIVMADQSGIVRDTDQFSQNRFQVLTVPIGPNALLRSVESVI